MVLAFFAVRAAVRRERFGKAYIQFASLPFSPGKPLRGTIHLRFNTTTRHGINLRLSCVRQIVTGGGKNQSTSRVVLWQSDKNVSEQSITPGPMGDAAIPVDFAIPSDAYETNRDDPRDQMLWSVHAEADTPGVSFSDDFEVPVFRLTPQPETAGSIGDPRCNSVSRLSERCGGRAATGQSESCGGCGRNRRHGILFSDVSESCPHPRSDTVYSGVDRRRLFSGALACSGIVPGRVRSV